MASMTNVEIILILGKRKYSLKIWKLFCDVFNVMPYAAVIEEKIFCVHGGISPELDCLEKIKKI